MAEEESASRAGLRNAVESLRRLAASWAGTLTVGGRPRCWPPKTKLLLLSYPLHPPHEPANLRTSHFPALARLRYSFTARATPLARWKR